MRKKSIIALSIIAVFFIGIGYKIFIKQSSSFQSYIFNEYTGLDNQYNAPYLGVSNTFLPIEETLIEEIKNDSRTIYLLPTLQFPCIQDTGENEIQTLMIYKNGELLKELSMQYLEFGFMSYHNEEFIKGASSMQFDTLPTDDNMLHVSGYLDRQMMDNSNALDLFNDKAAQYTLVVDCFVPTSKNDDLSYNYKQVTLTMEIKGLSQSDVSGKKMNRSTIYVSYEEMKEIFNQYKTEEINQDIYLLETKSRGFIKEIQKKGSHVNIYDDIW